MTKKLKYADLIETFKPGADEDDCVIITESVRNDAKTLKLHMTDPLDIDNFFTFLINTFDLALKNVKKIEPSQNKNDTLNFLQSTRSLMVNNKTEMIKQLTDKGLVGRELLVAMANHNTQVEAILGSPLVKTIGDLLVAATAQSLNQK